MPKLSHAIGSALIASSTAIALPASAQNKAVPVPPEQVGATKATSASKAIAEIRAASLRRSQTLQHGPPSKVAAIRVSSQNIDDDRYVDDQIYAATAAKEDPRHARYGF